MSSGSRESSRPISRGRDWHLDDRSRGEGVRYDWPRDEADEGTLGYTGFRRDLERHRDGTPGQHYTNSGTWPSGSYAGRGPKDYRRSDERIREDVSDRLTDDPHVDASEVSVQVQDGNVTLTGTVESRVQKRRAEDLVESVSGVKEVTNQLRVNRNARV